MQTDVKMSDIDEASIASLVQSNQGSPLLSLSRSLSLSDDGVDDGSMPLPPESYFPSLEPLENHAQTHAKHYGYALPTIRWKWRYKNRTICQKYTMGCYCTTKYQDRSKGRRRRRQKSIVKTDCMFSFYALQNEDGNYDLQHRHSVMFQTHNHGLTMNPAVHHQHCRLQEPALEHAKALITASLKVKDIITVLSKSEHVNILPL
jgi:hypothetical protein